MSGHSHTDMEAGERQALLPDEIRSDESLFWDAKPGALDPQAHAPYVISRVLTLGTLLQVRALLRFYGLSRLREFFIRGGLRQVDARTASFWLLVLDLSREECERRSYLQPRRMSWNG